MSESHYNYTYGEEEVNFFVGAFHDAVLRYGRALNQTLALGDDVTDGLTVTRRMWNYTTYDVTGDVIIDDNGDRDTNFAIKDMNPMTGDFEIVAMFWGATPGYTAVPGMEIHWAGGRDSPPPNTPFCGFMNENRECLPEEKLPSYLVGVIAFFAVIIVFLVIGFFIYRRVTWEKDLNSTAWRVNYDDIKFRHQLAHSAKLSAYSIKTRDSETLSLMPESGQDFTLVGSYKGETVAAKKVRMFKVDLNRAVLLEVKVVRDMHHENLTKFIGVCVEPGKLLLLYEYCKKGSLQDVLLTDTLKLDWPFKVSLLRDIVKGMIYIHQSELVNHGHLTSANCVVDGKFNVKVTDFGLPSFRGVDDKVSEKNVNRHSDIEKLLWVAPEHIRHLERVGASKKGDVFSFAIIMEEIISRSVPYDSHRAFLEVEEIILKIYKNENPPFRPEVLDSDVPDNYVALMERCWAQDPDKRPTFETILKTINTFIGGKEVALVDRLLKRLEEYTSNLEDLVEERTQQLAMEKRKSEMLLDEILPRSVSEKLKQGQPVDPEFYDMVTIYFSDIVGFTSLSAMSTPLEIVEFLNALYSRFDSAIENFDVYKIETIGDAYMVVSGLPLRNGNIHVIHIARLALQLLDVVADFEVPHKQEHKLQLRIGLHSGPVVAGVVGLKMPRYCLFGDTVNTASRMETNGAACKIHISQSTKLLLDLVGGFKTELRGDMEMKGKGVQTTYWLLGETSRELKEKHDNFKRQEKDVICEDSKNLTYSSLHSDKDPINQNIINVKENQPLQNGFAEKCNHWSPERNKCTPKKQYQGSSPNDGCPQRPQNKEMKLPPLNRMSSILKGLPLPGDIFLSNSQDQGYLSSEVRDAETTNAYQQLAFHNSKINGKDSSQGFDNTQMVLKDKFQAYTATDKELSDKSSSSMEPSQMLSSYGNRDNPSDGTHILLQGCRKTAKVFPDNGTIPFVRFP